MKPKTPSHKIQRADSFEELRELQRLMAGALFRPLTPGYTTQKTWTDGTTRTATVAASFIKPNDRLTSFDRLEIYNRCYWFRLLDCLYDDYPGLRALLGRRKFMALAQAYLTRHQSDTFTLRDLGSRLEPFLQAEPQWTAPHEAVALDLVRFEWAQIVAFDSAARPVVTPDHLLDTPPDRLRLALQPYLSLLALDYAVDDFLLVVKKLDSSALRGEASNTPSAAPTDSAAAKKRRRPRLPRAEKVHLAVHRCDNVLYYKRLDPDAFALLTALAAGETLEAACVSMISSSANPARDWSALIQEWFANWSALGWFCLPA